MTNYDFKMLTWSDFEDLCRDLISADFSCHVESFKDGKDQGIDLRYVDIKLNKPTIVQCKHYVNSGFKSLFNSVKDEISKLPKLNPQAYRLLTSVPLNPAEKAKIFGLLSQYMSSEDQIWGQDDLNAALGRNPQIEKNHFKLWLTSIPVLQRILNQRTHISTDFNVDKIHRSLQIYVDNNSYLQAREILEKEHALIISGAPGVGKTTLADILMFHYMAEGFTPFYITGSVDEIYDILDPNNKQVIVFDDFLGSSRFEPLKLENADRRVQDLLELVKRTSNTRFILTTREHILKQAQDYSARLSPQSVNYLKYVVDVGQYTRLIKAKILYNHLVFSKLPSLYIKEIMKDSFYKDIIDHEGFNPRIISWLGKPEFYSHIKIGNFQKSIMNVLDNPEELWGIVYRNHLSLPAQNILLALITIDNGVELNTLKTLFEKIHTGLSDHYNISRKPNDFKMAIKEVEDSFINIVEARWPTRLVVSFANPSLREFIEKDCWQNDEQIGVVLENISNFDQLKFISTSSKWLEKSKENVNIKNSLKKSILSLFNTIFDSLSADLYIPITKIILDRFDNIFTIKELTYFIDKLIPYLEERVVKRDDDATSTIRILGDLVHIFNLRNATQDAPITEKINVFKQIIFQIIDYWPTIDVHQEISDLVHDNRDLFSASEVDVLKDSFFEYVNEAKEDFSNILLEDIDDYMYRLQDSANNWNVDIAATLDQIRNYRTELEQEIIPDYDDDDDFTHGSDSEDNGTDGALDALFSTITLN